MCFIVYVDDSFFFLAIFFPQNFGVISMAFGEKNPNSEMDYDEVTSLSVIDYL